MRPAAAVRHVRKLARVSLAASNEYGCGRLEAARLGLRLRRRNGFDLAEALKEGLLDPAMSDEERYAHIGREFRRPAQDRLNPVSLEPFTEQKLVFYEYCEALGIPVPELYGAVGRAGGWIRASRRPVADAAAFARFVEQLPGEFVAKPAFGHLGLGVRVLSRVEGGLAETGGAVREPAALYREICADPDFDLYVVQERLHNHPEIAEIVGSPVLQTLRINTVMRPDGSALVFGGVLKLAVGTGDADNRRGGETGNGFSTVSLDDGKLGALMIPAPSGVGYSAVSAVPGTERRVRGRRVPFVADAVELVRRAAPAFLPMRTLGWDVAVTSAGPVVIEANNWWSPFTPLPAEAWTLLLSG